MKHKNTWNIPFYDVLDPVCSPFTCMTMNKVAVIVRTGGKYSNENVKEY
jgi:hypothetical protein